jgi:ATP-dependent DNA helicase RecQ
VNPNTVLRERFGLSEFRPGQEAVIEGLTRHGAALAVFPTGAGKSLCYQLPALLFDGVTLVISPLIALMKDQIDFLQARGIPAARLDSSLSADEARQVTQQVRDRTLKLLYVAPERFNNERFLGMLEHTPIALFAVDEAHCISEWGHNFRPDYLKLAEFARSLQAERILALTATATPTVVVDICTNFRIPSECAIVTGFFRANLEMQTTPVTQDRRDHTLAERLRVRPPGSTIVYVTLQKTAEQVAETLARAGFSARPYHAGLDDDVRKDTQDWWMASDRNIVVATIAFGMGIDKADVRYIYHYNLPKSLESYSQEIGRAGRDGRPATVELLACLDDVTTLENFAYGDTPAQSSLRSFISELLLAPPALELDVTDLSNRHDLRPLVLRTALTYLELRGMLRQGTPIYTTYQMRPLKPVLQIASAFEGERSQFIADLFAQAKEGTRWFTLDSQATAAALHQDRERIVRALDYMAQQQLVELRPSGVRLRFSRQPGKFDLDELTALIDQRFQQRELREIERIQDILKLVTRNGCQANALAAYFGEERKAPCGTCTFCQSNQPRQLFPTASAPPINAVVDAGCLAELRQAHPSALHEPRQVARFLCGLTSPALTRSKLARHALFGLLEGHRFADVLDWTMQTRALT